jgi:hypothetical protein
MEISRPYFDSQCWPTPDIMQTPHRSKTMRWREGFEQEKTIWQ